VRDAPLESHVDVWLSNTGTERTSRYFDDENTPLAKLARMVAAVVSVAERVPLNVSVADLSPEMVVPDDAESVDPCVAASNRTEEPPAGEPTPLSVVALDS
jgi:hypothetical protein